MRRKDPLIPTETFLNRKPHLTTAFEVVKLKKSSVPTAPPSPQFGSREKTGENNADCSGKRPERGDHAWEQARFQVLLRFAARADAGQELRGRPLVP